MMWISITLKFCMLATMSYMLVYWWLGKVKELASNDWALNMGLLAAIAMVLGALVLFGYWIQPDLLGYIR